MLTTMKCVRRGDEVKKREENESWKPDDYNSYTSFIDESIPEALFHFFCRLISFIMIIIAAFHFDTYISSVASFPLLFASVFRLSRRASLLIFFGSFAARSMLFFLTSPLRLVVKKNINNFFFLIYFPLLFALCSSCSFDCLFFPSYMRWIWALAGSRDRARVFIVLYGWLNGARLAISKWIGRALCCMDFSTWRLLQFWGFNAISISFSTKR